MLLVLEKLAPEHEVAFKSAMKEYKDKLAVQIPKIFWDAGDFEDFAAYLRRIKEQSECAYCTRTAYVAKAVNLGAVAGLVEIRQYFDHECGERTTLGDVEFSLRPTHIGMCYGKDLLKVALKECRALGMSSTILIVPKNNERLISLVGRYNTIDRVESDDNIMFELGLGGV